MESEREFTSPGGKPGVESPVFGKCRIISKAEAKANLAENEEFVPCEPVKGSKFNFYVDLEIPRYYAVRKTEK